MLPQGLCTFAGSQALLAANFTLSQGVSPSVASLTIAPQPGRVPELGPLVFRYGGTQIVFADCRLDSLSGEINYSGREVWRLAVSDRRWKWKFAGRISGRYNVRTGLRGALAASTEKSPRELARLCLVAMGERRFDVSRLPNDTRPEIDWDYDLPAEALARLCDALGARVVLRLDNSVALEPVGVGNRLAITSHALAVGQAAEPSLRPDALVLACGRTRWRRDLRLIAVGLEADGSLVPLDELSYAPSGLGSRDAWRYCDLPHFQCVSKPEARGLARQSVFRYYRIAVPFSLSNTSGKSLSVERLEQVLPLSNSGTEFIPWEGSTEIIPSESSTQAQPNEFRSTVYGVFHGGCEGTRSESTKAKPDIESEPRGLYAGDYSIDRERGLVIFVEPVFRYFDSGTSGTDRNLVAPAELYLRAWLSLRDAETGGWLRHELMRRATGKRLGTPPRYVREDDLALTLVENHVPPLARRIVDNRAAVEAEANRRLDAIERELRLCDPAHVAYAGLLPINPDGAITQVTWTISPEGFATTRASRNREDATLGPTHKERRFIERMKAEG